MTEEKFIKQQQQLIFCIKKSKERYNLKESEISSLNFLLTLVMKYTYCNRLKLKGLLKHTIVDSLEIEDDNLIDKVFEFDNDLK